MGNMLESYQNIRYIAGRVETLERENQARKQEVAELRAIVQLLEHKWQTLSEVAENSVFCEEIVQDADDATKEKRFSVAKSSEHQKKRRKPGPTSSLILNVKSWDETADIKEVERLVRSIEIDGLEWGTSKVNPLGYGIHLLQIGCVVEDEMVSVEELLQRIQAFEQCVQKVEIAALDRRLFID